MAVKKRRAAAKRTRRRKRGLVRWVWAIAWRLGVLGTLVGACMGTYAYFHFSRDLPEIDSLLTYRPNVITEVYSDDGTLIAEFGAQQIREVAKEKVPKRVKDVFIASEDHRFYWHPGIDPIGLGRAGFYYVFSPWKRRGGASTITMQVARTFFLTRERTFERKIKETILALHIERKLSKDEILYLYLNQVDFGRGCFGIGAAAEYYFNKSVDELTLGEAAMLAGILPAPSRYNPVSNFEGAKKRQKLVLAKLASTQVGTELRITPQEAERAGSELILVHGEKGPAGDAAPYFVEYVRRLLVQRYGEERVYSDGLKVFTTVNIKADLVARRAIREKLLGPDGIDLAVGFRRDEVKKVSGDEAAALVEQIEKSNQRDWVVRKRREYREQGIGFSAPSVLPDPAPLELGETYQAVVTGVDDPAEEIRVVIGHNVGIIDKKGLAWAKKLVKKGADNEIKTWWAQRASQIVSAGEVVLVETAAAEEKDGKQWYRVKLTQLPVIEGSLISMSTRDGHVKALVGGYDFGRSQFIRPVQAARQPGSAMKPLVYAAALDDPLNRYHPGAIMLDAPFSIEKGDTNPNCQKPYIVGKEYSPKNYGETFAGEVPLRVALAKSINTIAVRTAWDLCLADVVDYCQKLGIKTKLKELPCLPLGCSEVTLEELAVAYNVFASGGYRIEPVYITRIYDREGRLLEYERPYAQNERPRLERGTKTDSVHEEDLTAETPKTVKPPPKRAGHVILGDAPQDPSELGEPTWQEHLSQVRSKRSPWIPPAETPPQGVQVIDPVTAFQMTYLLQAVIQEGTGRAAANQIAGDIAGKTGTTNEYRDALFVGYAPELLAAVWIGSDEMAYSLGKAGTGSGAALPIWIDFIEAALGKEIKSKFVAPAGVEWVSICEDSGLQAGPYCKDVRQIPFKPGTAPKEFCGPGEGSDDGYFDPLQLDELEE